MEARQGKSPSRALARAGVLAVWLFAVVLGARLIIVTARATSASANGFIPHYTASRLVIQGAEASALYTDSIFVAALRAHDPRIYDIFGANPPTVALTAVPLAGYPYAAAKTVWTVVTAVLWLAVVAILARICALRGARLASFVCIGLGFDPAIAGVIHAQFHVLVLALLLIVWRAWRDRRDDAAGTTLGLVLALKSTGFAFWPMLAAQRRWRALAWGGLAIGVCAVAATLLIGGDAWALFARRAIDLNRSGSLTVTAYQSVVGLVRRITVADARWNTDPLFEAPRIGRALSWIVVLGLIGVSVAVAARRDDDALFAGFAALTLAVSPVSLDTHYALAILPVAVLLSGEQAHPSTSRLVLIITAALMIALPLPYRSPRLMDGALVIFAYPKLYGVLVLWALCLFAPAPVSASDGNRAVES